MKATVLTITLMFVSLSALAQCNYVVHGSKDHIEYVYVDFSFDVNNALDIDNTLYEPQGLDYDLELGMRQGDLNPYVYFGEYKEVGYQNYGVGIDYIFWQSQNRVPYSNKIEIGAGMNFGGITRIEPNLVSDTFFGYALRIKPTIEMNDYVSLFGKLQYQERRDRSFNGVYEFYFGMLLKMF